MAIFRIILFLCLFSGFHQIQAQESTILTYTLSCPNSIRAGDTIQVSITATIGSGWYIYAPVDVNVMQGVQVTNLKFNLLPAGLQRVGDIQFPPAKQKGSFAVYQGAGHTFTQRFAVGKGVTPGILTLGGKLTYQACNKHTCYPPITENIEKTVYVVSP